jgi:hypothetical protein
VQTKRKSREIDLATRASKWLLEAPGKITFSSQVETLRANDEFIVSRGRRTGLPGNVLMVSTAARDPSPATVAVLENVYSFRDELDFSFAARPLELAREPERLTLVLEDPGGLLLDGLVGRPLGVEEFLRLAIGLAARSTICTSADLSTRTSNQPISSYNSPQVKSG